MKTRDKYPSLPRTKETLNKLSRIYAKNVDRMIYCKNDVRRIAAIKREKKLDQIDILLRKAMGVYVYNPCPLSKNSLCEKCTGYVVRKEVVNKKGKTLIKSFMSKIGEGRACRLVKYAGVSCNNLF